METNKDRGIIFNMCDSLDRLLIIEAFNTESTYGMLVCHWRDNGYPYIW